MGTKLKYNSGGEVQEIPLSTVKPQGKRLAVHHNDQNFYAPLVDAGDATASNLRTTFMGEVFAIRQMAAPEIENILIEPPRVSVMQGQSATAIVSASGNEAVAGLSYSIANNPTWITISDECILIQPSDNDLGEAVVEVIAKDTGSNASMSTAFVAEALLRPIISSLSVVPPAVTVQQGQSATAQIEAVANSAVTGLSYSLDGAPSWVSNDYSMIALNPTTADSGTSTVNVVAYDTNSSARAETQFVATAEMVPDIYGVIASPSNITVNQGESAVITLSADYNTAVTGIEYSLENAPTWMTLGGNQITVAPTDTDLGTITVIATARDTGSHAQASTRFTAKAKPAKAVITVSLSSNSIAAYHGRTTYGTINTSTNGGESGLSYSLKSAPSWVTLSGSRVKLSPPTGTHATQKVTLVASDTGSTVSNRTTFTAIATTIMPSLSFSSSLTCTMPFRNTICNAVEKMTKNAYTVGLKYTVKADHPDFFYQRNDLLLAKLPDSVPIANNSITGNYTVNVADSTGLARASASGTYIADQRDVNTYTWKASIISTNGVTSKSAEFNSNGFNVEYAGAAYAQTLLADIDFKYPIPTGQFSLEGSYNTTSPPITLSAETNRKSFHIKFAIPKTSAVSDGVTGSQRIHVGSPSDPTTKRYTSPISFFALHPISDSKRKFYTKTI